jgi:hypothetical protein
MNGTQWNRKSFSLPAFAEGTTEEEYEGIFGSEEERKKKLRKAIEEQEARKKKEKGETHDYRD